MAWRLKKVEDQREYLVKSYLSKEKNMSDLCCELEVSRRTGYKWVKRYIEGGISALKDLSRAPKEPYRVFSNDKLNLALELKQRYPKYGPKKIHALLERHYPDQVWPCPSRLHQLFKEHHLVNSRKLRRKVPGTHPLGEIDENNQVWCIDFKGWFLTGDHSKVEPLTITDGYSRFVICCQHLERKGTEEVWGVYKEAFLQFGLPRRIRTDNGPPFASTGVGRLSRLAVYLVKAGIVPEWINPGHPEENGRHERFHRSLKEGIANPPAYRFQDQIRRMSAYVEEYNFDRPHEALNFNSPGSIYRPSPRVWNGILRSPEYDTNFAALRKVGSSGCIYWKQEWHYLGSVLHGEYVGLQEVDNDIYQLFYGPVLLGTLREGIGFELVPRQTKR